MSRNPGRTIQIYLPNGEPRGIRIAELTTRTVQAVLVPQSLLKKARDRAELDQIGVYFLFGEDDEHAKPIVYIGQTEDVRKRLDRHSNEKEFWQTAVVVISKTQAFTPAHIRWLEWYCCEMSSKVGRFQLENSQRPREPFLTEPLQDDCLDAFDNINILLTALGYPLFEPLAKPTVRELFFISGPDSEGSGTLVEDGFLVRKDSLCRKEIVESAGKYCASQRNKLIESGVLTDQSNKQLVFAQDYIFKTPSGAAVVILGRSSNGWAEWKNDRGKSLHDVKRAPMESDNE